MNTEETMNKVHRHTLGVAVLVLACSHCGATSAGGTPNGADSGASDAGSLGDGPEPSATDGTAPDAEAGATETLDDAGQCEGTARRDGGTVVPDEHRAQAATCSRNPEVGSTGDASAVSCASDAECMLDGESIVPQHCIAQQCGVDECFVDSDCGSDRLCVCSADDGGGLRLPVNRCVAAQCHVDADCGAGAYCSPSRGYCGSVDGFYCHTSEDTCVDESTDCSCGGNACVYAPPVGHFVCGTNICSG
jgi:hypothetical protein